MVKLSENKKRAMFHCNMYERKKNIQNIPKSYRKEMLLIVIQNIP